MLCFRSSLHAHRHLAVSDSSSGFPVSLRHLGRGRTPVHCLRRSRHILLAALVTLWAGLRRFASRRVRRKLTRKLLKKATRGLEASR